MQNVSRRDLDWAIAVALLTGTLFLITLRPDVGGTEDSPKFQFLGQVLGTAHTPGYPFYTIATWAFTRVPVGTLAWRVNLFSAVCGVFSCVIIFLMSRRLGVSRSLAAVAALAAATGFPVWSNAVTAEVYTLSALMSAWTIYLLIAWAQTGTCGDCSRHVLVVCGRPRQSPHHRRTASGGARLRSLEGSRRPEAAGHRAGGRDRLLRRRAVRIHRASHPPGRPYLEARATSLRGVYDVIIARDVSWARFYQAADKVVGIEVPMLLDGLRVHMGTVTVVLVVLAMVVAVCVRKSFGGSWHPARRRRRDRHARHDRQPVG